jgi:hypothetical protein
MTMSLWRNHRGKLLAGVVASWFALLVVLHHWTEEGPRTIKGAGELLDIGALPVT